MKRVYVNEQWCQGCHLCEYNCAFANSGLARMSQLKGKAIFPNIHIEEGEGIVYAVSCRHCADPLCVKGCIAGAISKVDGVVQIDRKKCVGCRTCVLMCPYGALTTGPEGTMQKCELCLQTKAGIPACAEGCPGGAIVYEERGEKL